MAIKCFLLEDTGKVEVSDTIVNGEKVGTRSQPIYKRTDTGEEMLRDNAPVGAVVRATWLESVPSLCGTDGKSYIITTPGGDWNIDGRASNCGLPDDDVHKCWCRHGEAPNFTSNKIGNTCNAGAGSIASGGYHGNLVNGELIEC